MRDDNFRKGFTLVELLAVIVILAIIMIIAIPSVLDTVETAKQKAFKEFMQKVYSNAQKTFMIKKEFEGIKRPGGYEYLEYIFDIKDDLELTNIGNFKGIVEVVYYGPNYARSLRENGWDVEEGVAYYNIELVDDDYYTYISTQSGVTTSNMYIWPLDEVIEEDEEWVESIYNKDNYIAYTLKYQNDIIKYYIGVDGTTNNIFLNTIPK